MSTEINEVWNSRPLDVHLISDHPSFVSIYKELMVRFPELDVYVNVPNNGKKAKGDSRKIFKAVLLDLYVCWCEDSTQWLGISTNNNSWNTGSRYNSLHISRNIKGLLDKLRVLCLIDRLNHRHSDIDPRFNHTARYRASSTLRSIFYKYQFGIDHVSKAPEREVIILRKNDVDGFGDDIASNSPVEYEDTDETVQMRLQIQAYNELLVKHHIDLGSAESSRIVISYWDKKLKKRREQKIVVGQHNKFVYRVFSRGSFGCHGRFYGGWWTRIPSDMRKDIFIDGQPTHEVDFKSLHIHLLSARSGVLLPADPYRLPIQLFDDLDADTQRKWMKALILHSINSKSTKEAFKAFRHDAKYGDPMKNATDKQLQLLLSEFIKCYPHLEKFLCSDQGIYLMRQDSDIAAEVIRLMTRRGIPVLCVHDSFIVDVFHWVELREAMTLAAMRIAGRDLLAEQDAFTCDREQGFEYFAVDALRSKRSVRECSEAVSRRLSKRSLFNRL